MHRCHHLHYAVTQCTACTTGAGEPGMSATTDGRTRAVRRARGVRGGGGRPAPRGRCRVGVVGDAVRPAAGAARLAGQLLNGGEVADATFRRQGRPADGATRARTHTLASRPCTSRRAARLNSSTSAPMPHPRPSPPRQPQPDPIRGRNRDFNRGSVQKFPGGSEYKPSQRRARARAAWKPPIDVAARPPALYPPTAQPPAAATRPDSRPDL